VFKRRIKNKILREVVEYAFALAIAAVVFFVVYNYVARTGIVDGVSMNDTLRHGQIVVINKVAYWFNEPRQGDIVTFPDPENPERHLIKRIVAVSGDEVDFIAGYVFVNGIPLAEEFGAAGSGVGSVRFPHTVAEGAVFVLGDNRIQSKDSRFIEVGDIPVEDITGRVTFRLLPFRDFGMIR